MQRSDMSAAGGLVSAMLCEASVLLSWRAVREDNMPR